MEITYNSNIYKIIKATDIVVLILYKHRNIHQSTDFDITHISNCPNSVHDIYIGIIQTKDIYGNKYRVINDIDSLHDMICDALNNEHGCDVVEQFEKNKCTLTFSCCVRYAEDVIKVVLFNEYPN